MERGERLEGASDDVADDAANVYRVAQFREKPKAQVAEGYLASGNFYWNAGIFVWRCQTILDTLRGLPAVPI